LKHPKDVMAYSYIIIDEIYFGPHRYLYLLMGVKYILIVHNVNKHSKLSYGKSSGFRGLVKQLLYKTYFKLAKGYIAVGENTCQSLMKISKKEVVLVPFNFSYINSFRNKQITIDNSNKYVYIVVPGQVNEYKRNYKLVFDAIYKYNLCHSENNIRFVMLGVIDHATFTKYKYAIDSCADKDKNVICFKEYISSEVYYSYLFRAGYLIENLLDTVEGGLGESYNESKETGFSFIYNAFNVGLIYRNSNYKLPVSEDYHHYNDSNELSEIFTKINISYLGKSGHIKHNENRKMKNLLNISEKKLIGIIK